MKRQTIRKKSSDKIFFENFYQSYRGLIYHIARTYTKDRVEELVQETILRLLTCIPRLREIHQTPHRVAAYLAVTVRSAYVDMLRKDFPEMVMLVSNEELAALQEEGELGVDLSSRAEASFDACRLKKKLSERDWYLLCGKYIIGYSDKEMAAHLKCDPNSIRMLLTRAKRRARRLLGVTGGDVSEE